MEPQGRVFKHEDMDASTSQSSTALFVKREFTTSPPLPSPFVKQEPTTPLDYHRAWLQNHVIPVPTTSTTTTVPGSGARKRKSQRDDRELIGPTTLGGDDFRPIAVKEENDEEVISKRLASGAGRYSIPSSQQLPMKSEIGSVSIELPRSPNQAMTVDRPQKKEEEEASQAAYRVGKTQRACGQVISKKEAADASAMAQQEARDARVQQVSQACEEARSARLTLRRARKEAMAERLRELLEKQDLEYGPLQARRSGRKWKAKQEIVQRLSMRGQRIKREQSNRTVERVQSRIPEEDIASVTQELRMAMSMLNKILEHGGSVPVGDISSCKWFIFSEELTRVCGKVVQGEWTFQPLSDNTIEGKMHYSVDLSLASEAGTLDAVFGVLDIALPAPLFASPNAIKVRAYKLDLQVPVTQAWAQEGIARHTKPDAPLRYFDLHMMFLGPGLMKFLIPLNVLCRQTDITANDNLDETKLIEVLCKAQDD